MIEHNMYNVDKQICKQAFYKYINNKIPVQICIIEQKQNERYLRLKLNYKKMGFKLNTSFDKKTDAE